MESGIVNPSSRRNVGSTGLSVSPVCVGCAPLGDMPETFDYRVGEEQARETLRAVFESPINFLDTAASYGDGESERRIGEVLKEMGGLPEDVVLATKADRDLTTGDFSGAGRCDAPSSVPCGYSARTNSSSCTCTTPSTRASST